MPAVDDGSKSIDVSLEMLNFAQKQGIKEVVNTVHFQHPNGEKLITYDIIKKKLKYYRATFKNEININPFGSEVFFYQIINYQR